MLSDAELQYYYHGLHRVLIRYRATSMLGWAIILLGCLSVPFAWNLGRTSAFIDVGLTALTVFAGLAVIWQNISALNEYIRVPWPPTTNGESNERAELIAEIKYLMKEVDDGGWQEAYAAIGRLNELQTKFGLPELKQ